MSAADPVVMEACRKEWATLVARAALRGYQLWRSDAADGEQRFFAGRRGLVHVMSDTVEVKRWLERAAK